MINIRRENEIRLDTQFSSPGGLQFAMKSLFLSFSLMNGPVYTSIHAFTRKRISKGNREEINGAVKRMIYTRLRKFKCFLQDVQDVHSGGGCLISIRRHPPRRPRRRPLWLVHDFLSLARAPLLLLFIHALRSVLSLLSDRATHGVNVIPFEGGWRREREEKKQERERERKKKIDEVRIKRWENRKLFALASR